MVLAVAMGLGYIGTLLQVLSFQCKKVRLLFVLQMVSGGLFVIHYGLKGDFTGMAMDILACLTAACMASGKKWLTGKPACLVLLFSSVALCVFTWKDIFSLFPAIAIFSMTIALFSGNGNVIRIVRFTLSSPGWMVYNIHVGSIPGLICEIMNMTSVAIYFVRIARGRKHGKQTENNGNEGAKA